MAIEMWWCLVIFLLILLKKSTHFYMSLFLSICLSVRPSVTHHMSGTVHHLIIIFGTHVWNDISRLFFHFFEILIFQAVRGVTAKNSPKWKISYICHVAYLRDSTAFDYDFSYNCVEWWYLQAFFSFSLIFYFSIC